MGRKQKELRNATRLTCLFFRHDNRILKLGMICRGTRLNVQMFMNNLHIKSCTRIKGTRIILFLCPSLKYANVQSIFVPLTSFALATALDNFDSQTKN